MLESNFEPTVPTSIETIYVCDINDLAPSQIDEIRIKKNSGYKLYVSDSCERRAGNIK